MKKLVVVMIALVFSAAACGGDDDAGSDGAAAPADSPLVQALADEVLDEDSPVSSQEEAECFASNVVNRVGEDRLAALGVTADNVAEIEEIDFTPEELDTIVVALGDCVDLEAALAAEFAEEFGEEPAQCLAQSLGSDVLTDFMALALADPNAEPPDEFLQAFLDAAAECDLPLN